MTETLAVFSQLLQIADGGIQFGLDPVWLALSIEAPCPIARAA